MTRLVKKFPFSTVAGAALLVLAVAILVSRVAVRKAFEPTAVGDAGDVGFEAPSHEDDEPEEAPIVTFADNLHVPWEVAFLPDGNMIVTERDGHLWRFGTSPASVTVPGVVEISEGGLLGLAVPPDEAESKRIYLYYTTRSDGKLMNRVSSFRFEDDVLSDEKIVIDAIPAGNYHDGGRIAFGPDGKLYVTTGDAGDGARSQDKKSLAGKILRVNRDGSIPADNPFRNAVWSYGHRNPQGIAWDDEDRLWATEHGRSGLKSGFDELNLIVKGGNYGWPDIEGDEKKAGMIAPVKHSGADVTWAPSGMAFAGDSLWFSGLRGESLYQATVADDGTISKFRARLRGEFGRIRAVVKSPDGDFYVTTSNDDGRGKLRSGDDRVLRISRQQIIEWLLIAP